MALRRLTTVGWCLAISCSTRCQACGAPGVKRPSTRGVRAPVMAVGQPAVWSRCHSASTAATARAGVLWNSQFPFGHQRHAW